MESIDDLLAQLKAEYQEKDFGSNQKKQPPVQEEEVNSPPPVSSAYQAQPAQSHFSTSADESLLAQVRAEFEEQERTEKLKRQQKLKEEQIQQEQQLREKQLQQEQRRQRKREALAQEAAEWLKNLSPRSEEGRWFEEFSYSYPSKLEAAIDYLEALRETGQ